MAIFLVDYQLGGKTYEARIEASSWDEAEARAEALMETGELSGQLVGEGYLDFDPLTTAIV